MNKLIFKAAIITSLTALSSIANATYYAHYPLELKNGGSLPDGSINIGDSNNGGGNGGQPTDPTDPTDPNNSCEFSNSPTTMIVGMNTANGPFKSGDMLLLYKGNLIGSFGPSGGTPLNGVTMGKQMTDSPTSAEFEICGSNLGSFPTIPFPTGTPPVDDNASTITFTRTLTYNKCEEARRVGLSVWGTDNCRLGGDNVAQTVALTIEKTTTFTVWTDFLSSADMEKIANAKTITTNTGKSCSINHHSIWDEKIESISCNQSTMILESEAGSTITFTIK